MARFAPYIGMVMDWSIVDTKVGAVHSGGVYCFGTAKVGTDVSDNDFEAGMVNVVKEHGGNFKNTESTFSRIFCFIFLDHFSVFVDVVMVAEARDVLGGGGFYRELCVTLS